MDKPVYFLYNSWGPNWNQRKLIRVFPVLDDAREALKKLYKCKGYEYPSNPYNINFKVGFIMSGRMLE